MILVKMVSAQPVDLLLHLGSETHFIWFCFFLPLTSIYLPSFLVVLLHYLIGYLITIYGKKKQQYQLLIHFAGCFEEYLYFGSQMLKILVSYSVLTTSSIKNRT